jgi:hypothetical protein
LLFRATRDGWRPSDFHQHCDGKERTFILFKSSKNYLSGGYASKPWQAVDNGGRRELDSEGFLLQLTHGLNIFRPISGDGVYNHKANGPFFSGALGIWCGDFMNDKGNGQCITDQSNYVCYNVPIDEQGNSVLTGEGADQGVIKRFTCVEIEVFLIE